LGSLTVALARTGAEITAIEFDRKLIPALEESVTGLSNVTIVHADATKIDWEVDFGGEDEWTACANLPYNVAVPIILEMLAEGSAVKRFVLMVQREVGQRLTALAGSDAYGAVSVRIAYRARASLVRRVPPDVFWPRPAVESVIVKLERRDAPAVDVDPARLWRVIDAGFGQKRKTMRNGLRRMGLSADEAAGVLARSGIESQARAEELTIEELASIAEKIGP
jgi:16S rRNA (adenine1518-N6/adenine1519-N6)-dimethyltransferase